MEKTIHLPDDLKDKVDYMTSATGKSFSLIVREALDEYYARLKRIEQIRELEEQVCGKALNAPVDEILQDIEEMRHESDRI